MNNSTDLLYATPHDIEKLFNDTLEDNKNLNISDRFNRLCEDLFFRPLLSSRMRGSWDRHLSRTLSKEEVEKEVGWLYKNSSAEDLNKLSDLNSKNLKLTHFVDRSYVERVRQSKIKCGKIRTSRMRSSYTPINEINSI